jgi:hypothetical protein
MKPRGLPRRAAVQQARRLRQRNLAALPIVPPSYSLFQTSKNIPHAEALASSESESAAASSFSAATAANSAAAAEVSSFRSTSGVRPAAIASAASRSLDAAVQAEFVKSKL